MKQILAIFLLLTLLPSCNGEAKKRNVSIMQNEKSIINDWYGENHFEPGEASQDEPLNKTSEQSDVEITAQKPVLDTTSEATHTDNISSTANNSSEEISTNLTVETTQVEEVKSSSEEMTAQISSETQTEEQVEAASEETSSQHLSSLNNKSDKAEAKAQEGKIEQTQQEASSMKTES